MANELVRVEPGPELTRDEMRAEDRVPPGYYVALNADAEAEIEEGLLVLVTRVYRRSDDKKHYNVQFQDGDRGWHCDLEEFERDYRPEPNGRKLRQEQITKIMDQIDELAEETPTIQQQLTSFQPHVDDSGDVQGADVSSLETPPTPEEPKGTALAPVQANALVKKAVALMRNSALKLQKELKQRQELLKAYIQEQALALKAKAEALTALVKQAEETIWTINLYLGKDEEIRQIRKGKPAPKDAPIVIRQKVHYMDEECAALADTGGIDIRDIKEFDKWISGDPKNLQAVSPDEKCVIAMKPRHRKKEYSNAWEQKDMDEANHHTYFLIRNGENIYRIWTDFNISGRIVPRRKELMDVFYGEDVDWQTDQRVKRPLKPGSKEYMEAMKEARDTRLHYFRVMLILQGLIDRTAVFQPLPAPRINILDPNVSEEWLRIIYDDQPETIITDGRPEFHEWLAKVNESMCVGQRVMGHFKFSSYSRDQYTTSDKEKRILPVTADNPESEALHTLEKRSEDGKGFYIYYERGEIYKGTRGKGWRRTYVGYEKAEVRARCLILREDDFVLNFDSAPVEEMRYYLKDRVNREHYADMFPLLTRAIEIKEAEENEEAPFKLLLVGQIMSAYGVSNEVAEGQVPELVRWWKFKNQTHRALLSDDALAIKMVLEEFGLRRKRAAERDGLNEDRLVQRLIDDVKRQFPSVVLIAHKKANEYVAFISHNDENVYVQEQLWAINRSSNCADNLRVRLKEQKDWKTVDTRWERWEVLYKHERFDGWIKDARAIGYLTDPERRAAIEQALREIGVLTENIWAKRDKEQYDVDDWKDGAIALGASLSRKDEADRIVVYVCDREAIIPTDFFASTRPHEPSIAVWKMRWKRGPGGEPKFTFNNDHHCCVSLEAPPWRPKFEGSYYEAHGVSQVLWEDEAAVARILKQQVTAKQADRRWRDFSSAVDEAISSIREQMAKAAEATAYHEFIAEHGDPELWTDHKKTIKITTTDPPFIRHVFTSLIDRSINADGMTLQQAYDRAWPSVMKDDRDDAKREAKRKARFFSSEPVKRVPKDRPKLDPVVAAMVVKHDKLMPVLGQKRDEDDED